MKNKLSPHAGKVGWSIGFAVFAAATLVACSLAPSYQRPQAPVPAAWENNSAAGQKAASISWREFFADAQLTALIDEALANNRDLAASLARVEEARALYGVARADRLPTLSVSADRQAARTPANLSPTGQTVTSQRYDAGLAVPSFELDFWGRVSNAAESANAAYLASEAAARAFRLSLIADVANAWYVTRELTERQALAADTVETRQRALYLMQKRADVGVASQLDVNVALNAANTARADLANADYQLAAARHALDLLVGKPVMVNAQEQTLTEQPIKPLAAGIPSEVLLARPDIVAAEQNLIAANANIGAARAAFLPRINLTAFTGYSSAALNGLFTGAQRAWTFSPVLSLPLFDFGRVSDNVDVAKARKVGAVAAYEKSIEQAFREVADLLAAQEHIGIQATQLKAAAAAMRQRAQLIEARARAGIASDLEVVDARRDANLSAQAALSAQRAALSTAAQLYKALGGGAS